MGAKKSITDGITDPDDLAKYPIESAITAMDALLSATLSQLERLVAFDTRNPPRRISADGVFAYLQSQLRDFRCELIDHGDGSLSLHAVRGNPLLLWNVHLDTVPDSPQWTINPFSLRLNAQRAYGLGVCDIKGAAAALIAAVNGCQNDAALLFTSDEENNDARAVSAFVQRKHAYAAVIVAEPTQCQAVLTHRGICSVRVGFVGKAVHGSFAQINDQSAVHKALVWGAQALKQVASYATIQYDGLEGLRFNIGTMAGGIKGNIVAPSAELRCSMRPLPSMDTTAVLHQLATCAAPCPDLFDVIFQGPSLPSANANDVASLRAAAVKVAEALKSPIGPAVDFWTEAALFSAAGFPSFVFGPGDIRQAHSADEFIEISQLESYVNAVYRMLTRPSHLG